MMEKDISRKIKLLKILAEEKKWFTLSELEQKLDCSSKTIRKDISVLNDLLPQNASIFSKKGKGIKLAIPQDQTICEVISNLSKKSLTFLVLQKFLEGTAPTITSLSEKLYLPVSSTNMALKRVSKYIEKFGLSLEKKPLGITGDEFQIILMFSERYLEAFTEEEWPFNEYRKEVLLGYISYIEKKLGIIFFTNDRRRFVFIMAILFIRRKRGHRVKFNECIIKNTIETPYYKEIFERGTDEKREAIHFLTIEEKVLLVIIVKLSRYVSVNQANLRREELKLYKEGKIQAYTYISEFIHILEREVKIDLASDEDFVYGMVDYCRHTFYKLMFLPKIIMPEKETCKYIKKTYKKTFLSVKKAYNEWAKKLEILDVPDEEAAKITMRIAATGRLKNMNKKKVLLVTGEEKSWEIYMKSWINKKFDGKLEIIGEVDRKMIEGDIKSMDIDFIITTIPLTINFHSIVHVSPILQERDFNEIEIFVNQNG